MVKAVRWTLLCIIILSSLAACGAPAQPATPAGPTATPIPGFEKFEGKGMELWLPDSFEGGKLTGDDLQIIIDRLNELGPEFEQTTQAIKNNPDLYLLWTFDGPSAETGFLTNVNVTTEKVLSAIDLDAYLDAVEKQLPPQFVIKSRDIVTVAGQPAGRVETDLADFGARQLIYIIKHDNRIFAVTYTTASEEFDQRRASFEQSIQTFVEVP